MRIWDFFVCCWWKDCKSFYWCFEHLRRPCYWMKINYIFKIFTVFCTLKILQVWRYQDGGIVFNTTFNNISVILWRLEDIKIIFQVWRYQRSNEGYSVHIVLTILTCMLYNGLRFLVLVFQLWKTIWLETSKNNKQTKGIQAETRSNRFYIIERKKNNPKTRLYVKLHNINIGDTRYKMNTIVIKYWLVFFL